MPSDSTPSHAPPSIAARLDALLATPPAKPTLVYFDIIGIAWPIRCALHLANVDYDLVQIPIQDWLAPEADGGPPLRARILNGHLPLYFDGDLQLNQSQTILTHIAERHDLVGDSPRDRLAITEVMIHAYDALFHWSGLFGVNARFQIPDDVVEARLAAFLGEGAWGPTGNGYARNLDAFVRYLQANPIDSGFIVGDRLSAADLHAFNVLANWYKAFDRARFVDLYPELDAYLERIAATPGVRDYIQNHQEATTWIPLEPIGIKLTTPEESRGLTSAGPA